MSTTEHQATSTPRVGMLGIVRNRRGVISAVEAFNDNSAGGELHLVTIGFNDADGNPEESLLWEREVSPVVLEPNALPRVDDQPPMQQGDFLALQRATRWSSMVPFLSARSVDERAQPAPTAPVYGAVSVDGFQLVPLARAMQMPRVSLLLADDVGLGKTIEAGLILAELIRKRRIRRVLILTPASLRTQWQEEMSDKFSLSFDIVDRRATHKLQKDLGLDANPWRALPRIIASYHYLRQPDVLEQFIANCESTRQHGGARLPWDLLIVDEAHNLMPSNFGEDSDLANMLRQITPYFEHRLFLTATPHNGYTRCFSGLLEQLDPVRFAQTPEFTDKERAMIDDVLVRRLKSEINEQDRQAGRTPRFAQRHLEPLPLYMPKAERQLSDAVRILCEQLKARAKSHPGERLTINFAIEILRKRLLSCPVAFADSWLRFKQGLEQAEEADQNEIEAARRSSEEDIDDDEEKESRNRHAAHLVGAWLHPFVETLRSEIHTVDEALATLGLDALPVISTTPVSDVRLERLLELIERKLRNADQWMPDERLIVFTEYKTTLDYLLNRLRAHFDADDQAILELYGGMTMEQRDAIKRAFNDPASSARILVTTDAASEGLNLQYTARYLAHYEIPWNPSRLEQRNGRIDRHGQARDVTIFHFTSDDDADLQFVARVLHKVNEIRDDLGSVGELFDAAFQRRMLELNEDEQLLSLLDRQIEARKDATRDARGSNADDGEADRQRLAQLRTDLDLSPQSLQQTLAVALKLGASRDLLDGPDSQGRMRLRTPLPGHWQSVIDDYLRLGSNHSAAGALPWLAFDHRFFEHENNGRPVFRPSPDTVLMHLGHPLFQHALNDLARLRFPGGHITTIAPSRWTVTRGQVPSGQDALILLSVEELAINELRETFHAWVRTLALPVSGESLGQPLSYAGPHHGEPAARSEPDVEAARDLWDAIDDQIKDFLSKYRQSLSATIQRQLEQAGNSAMEREKTAFHQRIVEVSNLQRTQSIEKIKREIEEQRQALAQQELFDEASDWAESKLRDLQDELQRRQSRFGDLQARLESERDRIVGEVLPRRHALRGQAQVFPVTVEIRFPEATA